MFGEVAKSRKKILTSKLQGYILDVYNIFGKTTFHNIVIWKSHINKGHGKDTKMIVQDWTWVLVCHLARYTKYNINKKDDFLFINIIKKFFVKYVCNIISLSISSLKIIYLYDFLIIMYITFTIIGKIANVDWIDHMHVDFTDILDLDCLGILY